MSNAHTSELRVTETPVLEMSAPESTNPGNEPPPSVFLLQAMTSLSMAGLSVTSAQEEEKRTEGEENTTKGEGEECSMGKSSPNAAATKSITGSSSSSSSSGLIMKTPLKASFNACQAKDDIHHTCAVCWSPMNMLNTTPSPQSTPTALLSTQGHASTSGQSMLGSSNMSTPPSNTSNSGSAGACTCAATTTAAVSVSKSNADMETTCTSTSTSTASVSSNDAENNNNANTQPKKPASVTKTRCGHYFHKRCLLETKLRKPECPMCRAPITPITNPTTVNSALLMQSEDLFASNMRDAVIHASHRGRNAVRAALQRQEEQERAAEAAAAAAAPSFP